MAAQMEMEEGGLRQLVEYLKNSLSGHDRERQKEAELVSLPSLLLFGWDGSDYGLNLRRSICFF
jgi:hypothetical protein